MSGIFYNEYPYTDFHQLNLTWLINELTTVQETVEQFVSINALKYADPIQWDITTQYEKNTIVIDPQTGTAYISVQAVPSGVSLANTDYWTPVFDLGSFVTRAAKNFTSNYEEDTTLTATMSLTAGEWVVWGDTLYRALVNITAGDSYVVDSNIEQITIEEIKDEIMSAMDALYTEISDKVGDLADLTTSDVTSIVNSINEVNANLNAEITKFDNTGFVSVKDFGAVGDGVTDDTDAFQAAIDSGYDVLVPTSDEEVYILSSTINITTLTQKIYSPVFNIQSCIYSTASPIFNVNAEHITFENIGISGDTTNTAIYAYYTDENTDLNVIGCAFRNLNIAVEHVGRGLHFENNTLNVVTYGIQQSYTFDGDDDEPLQSLENGDRAFRVINNRYHMQSGALIYNVTGELTGALISENILDIGANLLEDNGGIKNSTISNNVCEHNGLLLRLIAGTMTNCVIANNTKTSSDDYPSSYAIYTTSDYTITNCTFIGNIFRKLTRIGIFLNGTVTNTSFIGNIFSEIGDDTTIVYQAGIILPTSSYISIVGNQFNQTNGSYNIRATTSSQTFSNFQVFGNCHDLTLMGPYVDGGDNDIQAT